MTRDEHDNLDRMPLGFGSLERGKERIEAEGAISDGDLGEPTSSQDSKDPENPPISCPPIFGPQLFDMMFRTSPALILFHSAGSTNIAFSSCDN